MSATAIAGGLLAAGSLAGSLFQRRPRIGVPDVSAELARIRNQYARAREVVVANIRQQAGQTRMQAASNLAARGTLRSPVSENVFGRLREATGRDIATAEAQLGAQEAGTTSRVLQSLLGANLAAQQFNARQQQARQGAIFGSLGALGSSLLLAGLNRPAQPGTTTGALPFSPTGRLTFGKLGLQGGGVQAPQVPSFGFQPAIFGTQQGAGYLAALQAALGRR